MFREGLSAITRGGKTVRSTNIQLPAVLTEKVYSPGTTRAGRNTNCCEPSSAPLISAPQTEAAAAQDFWKMPAAP